MSIRQDEEETRQWDRFWGSGRVEDYLRYKNCMGENEADNIGIYCGDKNRKLPEKPDRFT